MANPNDPLAVSIPPLTTQSPTITSPSSLGLGKLSMHSRHHSFGTNPSMHRVTRRKSVSSSATNLAAVAQAVKDAGEMQFNLPPPNASMLSRSVGRSAGMGFGVHSPIQQQSGGGPAPLHGYPSPPSSLPTNGGAGPLIGLGSMSMNGFSFPRNVTIPSTTTVPGGITAASTAGMTSPSTPTSATSRRARRASEGAHMLLGGGGDSEERSRGKGGVELKCEKCGKGYKHSSCLTKHLWEHTPEWSLTSKLLISKHQQVQLLEAASILVSMNPTSVDNGNPTPAVSTISSGASINDTSSNSSSSEDTPPPTDRTSSAASIIDADLTSSLPTPRSVRARSGSKRLNGSAISVSRSTYNGIHGYGSHHHSPVPPILAGSVPTHINPGSNFPSHFVSRSHTTRQRAGSFVNTSRAAAAAAAAADEESLAAAVELLSCSFGAPPGTTPVLSPLQGISSPPPLGLNGVLPSTTPTPTTPTLRTSPGGFLDQLRKQARAFGGAGAAGDIEMKIEETEEEDGYYSGHHHHHRRHHLHNHHGGMASHGGRHHDDEMAVDDDDDDDEWERRQNTEGRMHTRGMTRRSRRKSEEEEDGVFGKMEE